MEKKSLKTKLIGDKKFYSMMLKIAVPIMIQNGISNFVSLLDNLMIGRVGTNELSGVAIANQLMFVHYLLIFGATAGVGIFTVQFFGAGDTEGVRISFRFKLLANTLLSAVSITLFYLFSGPLIGLFLQGEGSPENAVRTLSIGKDYLHIMLIGLIPVGLTNAWSGTLRDTGETRVPMFASLAAIIVNLCGNALLIYGLFGLPALGAEGAAVATVISRFVELSVLVIYTGFHSKAHPFIVGAFRHFHIPLKLAGRFIVRSIPLVANESLWALGITVMNQCYSYRSLDAVAALNIENTLWNLLGVAFIAMGDAVGIIVGQALGSGDEAKARDHAAKLIAFTVFCGTLFGLLMLLGGPFFPLLYNTTDVIRALAAKLIIVYALLMPFYAFTHASYFTIRSGGNTFITFLFDCCFVWAVSVPAAWVLSRLTALNVLTMVIIVQSLELIKCVIAFRMVQSGIWAKHISR